jgi:hypothetical protein
VVLLVQLALLVLVVLLVQLVLGLLSEAFIRHMAHSLAP